MSTLVLSYSHTGNSAFIARKISEELAAEREEIGPRMNIFPFQVLFSFIGMSFGMKKLSRNPAAYDTVILCGPIWMGQLVAPLRMVIKKHGTKIQKLCLALSCGGGDEMKDDKFGCGSVFSRARALLGDRCAVCEAFPVGLVLTEEERKDDSAIMKTRFSESNYSGKLEERVERFVSAVRAA